MLLFPRVYMTLVDFGYSVSALWFYYSHFLFIISLSNLSTLSVPETPVHTKFDIYILKQTKTKVYQRDTMLCVNYNNILYKKKFVVAQYDHILLPVCNYFRYIVLTVSYILL